MKARIPALLLMMASICLPESESMLAAQAGASADSVRACDLLSNADVQKVTGRVAGVGDSAAIYYRAKGEPRGLLVTYRGTRALTVQVDVDPGQLPESARPYAVELAKIALAKLK